LNLEPEFIVVSQEVRTNQHCPATVNGTKSQQATIPKRKDGKARRVGCRQSGYWADKITKPLSRERRNK
jgi:hypothetical protein